MGNHQENIFVDVRPAIGISPSLQVDQSSLHNHPGGRSRAGARLKKRLYFIQ